MSEALEIAIDPSLLHITVGETIHALGYPDGDIDGHFVGILEDLTARAPKVCETRAGYRVLPLRFDEKRSDGLYAGDSFFTTRKIVASQLRNASEAVLFLCTIGSGMETWSREEMKKGDELRGHFIDAIASIAVEKSADILHDRIEKAMADRGLGVTNRFSPGYCLWPVAEQGILFSFFPKGFCGISLNDSSLMLPIKSVSGIIGAGKDAKREGYVCDSCARKDCTYKAINIAKRLLSLGDYSR